MNFKVNLGLFMNQSHTLYLQTVSLLPTKHIFNTHIYTTNTHMIKPPIKIPQADRSGPWLKMHKLPPSIVPVIPISSYFIHSSTKVKHTPFILPKIPVKDTPNPLQNCIFIFSWNQIWFMFCPIIDNFIFKIIQIKLYFFHVLSNFKKSVKKNI